MTGDATRDLTRRGETMTIAQINAVCTKTYGAGIADVCGTTAMWVAESIMQSSGVNVWKKIARHREKLGKYMPFPEYGTEMFKTM